MLGFSSRRPSKQSIAAFPSLIYYYKYCRARLQFGRYLAEKDIACQGSTDLFGTTRTPKWAVAWNPVNNIKTSTRYTSTRYTIRWLVSVSDLRIYNITLFCKSGYHRLTSVVKKSCSSAAYSMEVGPPPTTTKERSLVRSLSEM